MFACSSRPWEQAARPQRRGWTPRRSGRTPAEAPAVSSAARAGAGSARGPGARGPPRRRGRALAVSWGENCFHLVLKPKTAAAVQAAADGLWRVGRAPEPAALSRCAPPNQAPPNQAEVTGLSTWTLVSTNESATPAQGPGLRAPPCPEPGWGGCGRSRREPHPLPPRVPLASVSASQSEYLIGFTIFFFIGNF